MYDLRHPDRRATSIPTRAPLLERNPLLFWKGVSALLAGVVVVLLALHFGQFH